MKDIFEVDPNDFDPYLEKLFMTTDAGSVNISLDMYVSALRRGMSPKESYEISYSEPDETGYLNLIDRRMLTD